jgi:mycothiol maleylpyruvate isomerase-like protein
MLDRLVTGLRPADWNRRVPRPEGKDPWTVKDALAHVVYWKEHTARVIRGERRPAELRGLDVHAGNHLIYQRWRRRRPSEVVRWHRSVQADVLRTLAEKPADWFTGRERGPTWPYDLDGHSAYHRLRDIEAAIGRTR